MDSSILIQALNEQAELLRKISQRLDSIEKELKRESSPQPEVQQQIQGSSALAHLNSLGIPY
jgi:hypothetical protein